MKRATVRREYTRRAVIRLGGAVAAAVPLTSLRTVLAGPKTAATAEAGSSRPAVADRKFHSPAVEQYITETQRRIGDLHLAVLFANCFPNTLDTTVQPGTFEGKPDTVVITGDIDAMWMRDSSAQVWPYLPLTAKDVALRKLVEGVLRRQTRCILIDPYANAFMADLDAAPLSWSREDKTEMRRGVGERKYELDSLCYPIRLAYGYWKATGDSGPFDSGWAKAMRTVVATMQMAQHKHGPGPYHFQRKADTPTETLGGDGYGPPVNPVGLIASGFRPSDDACTFPFLVSANLFAVTSLRQLAQMAHALLAADGLANQAQSLAGEVEQALRQYGTAQTPGGSIWAYEVDGFGSQLLMDDANVPSLLSLPYLGCSPDAALYARTRAFVWSARNPWFFRGSAGEGVGGPHVGMDMIWPMSQMVYALTSTSDAEIRYMLGLLKASAAGTGFMHESYSSEDAGRFTRAWFAWANTLFGELVGHLAASHPELLRA